MPFPNGFSLGGNNRINTNIDPTGAPTPPNGHHAGTQRRPPSWERAGQGLRNETSGVNPMRLAAGLARSVFSIGPSYNNFFRAVESVYGAPPRQDPAHVPPHATHGHQRVGARFSGENIGTQMEPMLHMFQHGIMSGLQRIFDRMDSDHIHQELRTYQLDQQEYLRNNMNGPPPVVPSSIPSHLRDYVAMLDPSDENFGHQIYELVMNDSQFQQRTRDQINNNIGTAPRPNLRHEHGHGGNAYEPELAPNGEPLFEESAGFEPSMQYENRRNSTPSPTAENRPNRQATVQDETEEQRRAGTSGSSPTTRRS
ncbi:hypothetical protein [Herbaspirillum sp. SJZ099]|uniref:hypothetical protein n=1 Tax=Herbaspirillum sp. SJZ099 TaxID=2572916 RepID=UPI0011A5BEEC|nr:hypothetical protein [Herbaspirillum sp. SJZ099]